MTASHDEFGEDIYCPKCTYGLHLAPGDKCSECGYSLANLRSMTRPIPWTQRKERGWFKSYWQTVSMVTFRPLRFCEYYAHEVRLRDAHRFQYVTVLHVYLPVLLATVVAYMTIPIDLEVPDFMTFIVASGTINSGPTLAAQAIAEIWPIAVMHGFFLLFLFGATGIPSYFFHPRSVSPQRQDNAVAMSYYACAPLVLFLPLVMILCGLVRLLQYDRWLAYQWGIDSWFGPALLIAATVILVAYWLRLLQLMRRIMPQLSRRGLALALSLPLLWTGLGITLLGLLPLSVLYVLMVIFSFGP